MLKPAHCALSGAVGVVIGLMALVVCLAFEAGPILTSVLPVGVGVCAMQTARGVLRRRAWQRTNAERG